VVGEWNDADARQIHSQWTREMCLEALDGHRRGAPLPARELQRLAKRAEMNVGIEDRFGELGQRAI
jgi:hypothetical protein